MVSNRKLRQLIEAFLAQYPHCRDDDQRLIANIWQQEILAMHGQEGYNTKTCHDILSDFATGKLSSPESIRRTRQKIQELQPLLRGEKYQQRQKHQGEVKKEIRNFR